MDSSKGRHMNKEIWQKPIQATDVGGEALIEGGHDAGQRKDGSGGPAAGWHH